MPTQAERTSGRSRLIVTATRRSDLLDSNRSWKNNQQEILWNFCGIRCLQRAALASNCLADAEVLFHPNPEDQINGT